MNFGFRNSDFGLAEDVAGSSTSSNRERSHCPIRNLPAGRQVRNPLRAAGRAVKNPASRISTFGILHSAPASRSSSIRNPQSEIRNSALGAALLEVVFSVAIFAFSSIVILNGMNSALAAADRVMLQAKAVDLAVTRLSELQMVGGVPQNEGPLAFEEGDDQWTWEVIATPAEVPPDAPTATQVKVVVTYLPTGYSYSIIHLVDDASAAAAADASSSAAGGSQ